MLNVTCHMLHAKCRKTMTVVTCYNLFIMESLYLDLSDSKEMINFLSEWMVFSSGKIKSHADSYI
jgi:hypothetical protein